MADMVAIRNALAASITRQTGLRADADPRDSVSPPCAIVMAGQTYINLAVTMDGCLDFSLTVVLLISDAAPAEAGGRALDTMVSSGPGSDLASSITTAIESDNTLGGLIDFIQGVTVGPPQRIEWAGIQYLGCRINVIASGQ